MDTATALLVDSHVHLDRYTDEDVRRMVSRAEATGVHRLLTIGSDLATSRAALDLAARYPGVLAAVGIHPTRLTPGSPSSLPWDPCIPTAPQPPPHCDGEGETRILFPLSIAMGRGLGGGASPVEQLRALLQYRPAAIGEIGLDAQAPDMDGQARFLDAGLALAEEHGLPIVLHVVGAVAVHEAALALVARRPTVRAVAHYFVGGPDLARRYLEHGCWISVGRPVTRPTEITVRQAVPTVPLDRLLLETDTYPLRRTTEPRDVATVCAAVAELTGRRYAEIAAATTASFAAFIGAEQTS